MNLINMDRTQGELTNLILRTIRLRGSLQTSDPKVNLLIRLTTIDHLILVFVIIKKGKIIGRKCV